MILHRLKSTSRVAVGDRTPFYELTENGVEPAFTLTGGASLTTIVRVR